MEPLSALSLAGNIVQFLQFASQIVSVTTEIAASGTSQDALEIEDVYAKLAVLSDYFASDEDKAPQTSGFVPLNGASLSSEEGAQDEIQLRIQIQSLGRNCRALCNELLETIRGLRRETGSSVPFKSLRAALRSAWNGKKIRDFEDRLQRYRQAIATHFFPLLSSQQKNTHKMLENLRYESARLRLDQKIQFDNVASKLHDLKILLRSRGALDIPSSQDPRVPNRGPRTPAHAKPGQETIDDRLNEITVIQEGIAAIKLTTRDLNTIERQQAIVRSLDFPRRPQRHEDIPLAHQKTLRWLFEPDQRSHGDSYSRQSGLLNWLRSGTGIFWIAGKAGSGKSTLMKFIADHEKTREALQNWAGSSTLVLASHFFWTAGTDMQKSQLGLFHTLLHAVFRTCPESIPLVCPDRWAKTADSDVEPGLLGKPWAATNVQTALAPSQPWSNQELLEALQRFPHSSSMSVKFCLLIDGLDEFSGNHAELSTTLRKLANSAHLKLCLSSRPWNIFEDQFGRGQTVNKLRIDELTRNDIRNYVQERLMKSPRWDAEEFPLNQMELLVQDITAKAHGVFLWVFLVTRSLLQGLVDGDTMADLRRRLESLPTELEAFLKHMIDLVDPFYHRSMARMLQMATNGQGSLGLQVYQVADYEEEDDQYSMWKPVDFQTLPGLKKLRNQWRRRINARCGGLLELKKRGEDYHVEFLHRTARDLLLTRDMSDFLSSKTGDEYMVNLSTLKAFVFLYRCWVQSDRDPSQPEPFWRDGLKYANPALHESKEAALAHLDTMGSLHDSLRHSENNPEYTSTDFRFELVQEGIDGYVAGKLAEDPGYFDDDSDMALHRAIMPAEHRDGKWYHKAWTQGHIDVIVMLLQSGHNPNLGSISPAWHQFLERACDPEGEDFKKSIENSLFYHFLKHGAWKDVRVREGMLPCTHFVRAVFRVGFSHRFANQCFGVLDYFLQDTVHDTTIAGTTRTVEKTQIEDLIWHLQAFDASADSDPVRTSSLARVTQKIIIRSIQLGTTDGKLGASIESLLPFIDSMFSSYHGAATLIDLATRREDSPYYQKVVVSQRSNITAGTSSTKRHANIGDLKENEEEEASWKGSEDKKASSIVYQQQPQKRFKI